MKTTTATIVNIKATTWDKDSQDLFDYESRRIKEKTFEISSSANVFKIDEDVFLDDNLNGQTSSFFSERSLVTIAENKGSFSVCKVHCASEGSPSNNDNVWLVVKSVIPSNVHYRGHALNEGDIIKLGKVKLRVREIKTSFNNLNNESQSLKNVEYILKEEKNEFKSKDQIYPNFIQKHNIETLPKGQEFTCRICLESDYDEKNPFIAPCSCSGSVKHIHLDCLKQWIESKRFHKVDVSCETYMWKDLECELCHNSLPDVFLKEDKEIHLVDLARPLTPYLILETMPEKKDIRKVFYVASINQDNSENVLMLGRKSDCHVKINDISVSRIHAMIKLQNGKFYLENGFSKFGTLLLLRNEVKLAKEYNLSIQVGRTVLSFELGTKEVLILPEPEKVQFQINVTKNEEEEAANQNNISIRKMSNDSHESNFNASPNYKSSLNEISDLGEEKNNYESYKNLSFTDNLQNELKHLDELIASMKEILGDRYISGEGSQPIVPESVYNNQNEALSLREENRIENRYDVAENH